MFVMIDHYDDRTYFMKKMLTVFGNEDFTKTFFLFLTLFSSKLGLVNGKLS